MRFGKRLFEVTKGCRADEPFLSYKELKHTLSKIASLITSGEDSSDDDRAESQVSPSKPPGTESTGSTEVLQKVAQFQQEFFNRVSADVAAARLYVQGAVAGLEAQVGEWQYLAITAGLLFTPEQLEDAELALQFNVRKTALVDLLISLRGSEGRRVLMSKFRNIAISMNALLLYIEVNLTAVRKIFKKFDKKVPAERRTNSSNDYKLHHGLLMPSMQNILVTIVQIQRLILSEAAVDLGVDSSSLVPLSPLGPETTALLTLLRGPALAEMLGNPPQIARIDFFAKPSTEFALGGTSAAASSSAGPLTVGLQRVSASSAGSTFHQGIHGLQAPTTVDIFRGPPAALPFMGGNAAAKTLQDDDEVQTHESGTKTARRRGGRRHRAGKARAAGDGEAEEVKPLDFKLHSALQVDSDAGAAGRTAGYMMNPALLGGQGQGAVAGQGGQGMRGSPVKPEGQWFQQQMYSQGHPLIAGMPVVMSGMPVMMSSSPYGGDFNPRVAQASQASHLAQLMKPRVPGAQGLYADTLREGGELPGPGGSSSFQAWYPHSNPVQMYWASPFVDGIAQVR